MNLQNLVLGVAIIAAPVQASFISNSAKNPFSDNQVQVQTFSSPTTPIAPNFSPVTNEFLNAPAIGVYFLPEDATVYDPNQAMAGGNCMAYGNPDADCIANFTENADGSYKAINTTSFTFYLAKPATQVAFFMIFDELPGADTPTQITLNGGTGLAASSGPVYSETFEQNSQQLPWFLGDLGGSLIYSVTLTGIGANTTFTPGYAYGIVLSHVETPIPEPGTVLLIGMGLAAAGFLGRRRSHRA
jgi:PEP-CTERM motif